MLRESKVPRETLKKDIIIRFRRAYSHQVLSIVFFAEGEAEWSSVVPRPMMTLVPSRLGFEIFWRVFCQDIRFPRAPQRVESSAEASLLLKSQSRGKSIGLNEL